MSSNTSGDVSVSQGLHSDMENKHKMSSCVSERTFGSYRVALLLVVSVMCNKYM